MSELDELLGEQEGEATPSAPAEETTPTGEGSSETKPGEESKAQVGLRREIEKLRKERKEEREKFEQEITSLKKTLDPFQKLTQPEEKKPVDPRVDNTVDTWATFIEEKTEAVKKEALSATDKILQAQKSKALKFFVKNHPEYALTAESGRQKLESLMATYGRVKTRSDADYEEILEDFEDSWAIENRSVLRQEAQKLKEFQSQAENDAALLAASSGTSSVNSDAEVVPLTPKESKVAKELGIDPKTYAKYKDYV